MFDLSKSESRTQASRRIVAALTCTSMEIGGYHHGLRDRVAKDDRIEGCNLGKCGLVDKVRTLHSNQ
jgi:hypothetical protein